MIWIVVCGAPQTALPARCTAEAFNAAMASLPDAAIVPYTEKPMKPAGRVVFCAPGRRAKETAEQVIPGAELREEPLLAAAPPCASGGGEHSPRVWRLLAGRKSADERKREQERAHKLILRLEKTGEDCVLIAEESFLPALLDAFRRQGYSQRRSGLGRVKPFEQFLLTPRALHCGGCAHNCLLSNPGCGVGKDKAMRLQNKQKPAAK